MAKKKAEGYLSAKESRLISKQNRKITDEYEKKRKRKNVPESEYTTEMKDAKNAGEFDNLHTYFFTDTGVVKSVDGVTFNVPIGKTVGIVGLGAIGQRVAKLAQAFGCNVIAWNRTVKNIDGITLVDKETLFKESDIITLHIALNNDTRDFVSAKEINLMKESAILVNAARGPIINVNDIAEALKNGRIAGAAIDVYDREHPIAEDNPLLSSPNTILLPHIGFATEEAFDIRLKIVVENVEKYLS